MTEKPTHIRILLAASLDLSPGRVYEVVSWRNGQCPRVTNDNGTEQTLRITTWEPAEPPAAYAMERAAASACSCPNPDHCDGSCTHPPPAPTGYPDDNPKTVQGLAKPGLRAVPPVALLELGRVMSHGAEKYGRFNYRANRITASTYYDAAMRHLMAWHDGQDDDPESGLPHLAHVMACCGIALDSASLGMLNDDRTRGMFAEYVHRHTAEIPQ